MMTRAITPIPAVPAIADDRSPAPGDDSLPPPRREVCDDEHAGAAATRSAALWDAIAVALGLRRAPRSRRLS